VQDDFGAQKVSFDRLLYGAWDDLGLRHAHNAYRRWMYASPRLTKAQFMAHHMCREEASIHEMLAEFRRPECAGKVTEETVHAFKQSSPKLAGWNAGAVGVSIRENRVEIFGTEGTPMFGVGHVALHLVPALDAISIMVDLPDVEMVVAPMDGGIPNLQSDCIPVFSADRNVRERGAFMPPRGLGVTWQTSWFMLETHPFYSPVTKKTPLHTVRSGSKVPIRDRIPKAVFRGSPTGVSSPAKWREVPRTAMCRKSVERPDLINAKYVFGDKAKHKALEKIDWFVDMQREGLIGNFMSYDEQQNYMLSLVPDGNTTPDRLIHFLLDDVVVLKHDSDMQEFWYPDLVPWKHYIPYKQDSSDLVEVVERAISNVTLLEEISQHATHFALSQLNANRVMCYWMSLIHAFSEIYSP